ncbi:MAG: vanadium-dependent haloperoxidase, partial [Planctomycetes bacterium]|nr:vanadium-dependent haloperoxidase [Planctomycetota bacterium]
MNRTIHTLCSSAAAASLCALSACSGDGSSSSPAPTSPATSTFSSTVAVEWHETLYTRIRQTGVNPPRAARVFAYTGVALYESVVHGMPGSQSLEGQLNGLVANDLPNPVAGQVYNWAIVANRALNVVSNGLVPSSTTEFDAQEASLLATLSTGVATAVVDRSVDYGDELGNAILAWAATDGTATQAACQTNWVAPVPPNEGGWTPVSGSAQPLLPCWGDMRTFVVTDGEECEPVGPPAFSTATSSPWFAQALLVYNTTGDAGASLTADQADIGLYWADGAGATGTPPGHWVAITCQIAADEALTLDVAAEAFARVGMAVADAFITCWKEKYTSYLMRPATYIRSEIDAGWDPLIGTPNFPTYTSGHSTQSGAAAAVLTHMFGAYAFTDTCHSRLNPTAGLPADRTFANFYEAASEAAVSRLYGGIHYVFDNYDGVDS